MKPADQVLTWVSAFRELRIARVRSAAGRLLQSPATPADFDPRAGYRRWAFRLAYNLLRLGHVEQANRERWRVVPPVLVWDARGRAILYGARTQHIRERLTKARGLTASPPSTQFNAPEIWAFSGDAADVESAAQGEGVVFALERGGDLLAALPPLADELASAPERTLPDDLERWDFLAKRWSRAPMGSLDLDGLFRTRRLPSDYFFRAEIHSPAIGLESPDLRKAAAWRLAVARSYLRYDASRMTLTVPAIGFGLPLLVDRGLILASGRLPERTPDGWEYQNIDARRAGNAARILNLRLEVLP